MLNTINKIIFLVILAVLAACSSPLQKSVLEPLKSKELDRVAGKDKSFLATYSIVEEKWNYISSSEDSARWRDITYARLHDYRLAIESETLNLSLFTQLRGKWENMYNKHSAHADSLILQWKEYLSNNSPDSLITLSFEGIELERIRNAKKEIDTLVKARIRMVPSKFVLDSVILLYSFSKPEESPIYHFPINGQLNEIKYKRKLKEPVVTKVFPYLLPEVKSALLANDTTYMLKYDIISAYANGKCFNADSLQNDLPGSVLAYIEAEKSAEESSPLFDQEYYKEKIIRELINPDFISQSAYIKINAEYYYKELDSLVFNYLHMKPLP